MSIDPSRLWIKNASAAPGAKLASDADRVRKAAEPPRILIVDDEERLARAYGRLLSVAGYQISLAYDAKRALAMFKETGFDVIVSDLAMPDMTGIDLLREIRNLDADVPFILVTAAATTESAVHAVEFGALRYLIKPVSQADLGRAVGDAIHLGRMAWLKREAEKLFGDYNQALDTRATLDDAFTRAVSAVYMAYQPIVSWEKKAAHGYEALVRSGEPALPHPGALFDAAERLDRVEELGRAIRARVPVAVETAPEGALIFVNLHTRDLADEDLFAAESPLAKIASRVVLEITERASLTRVDNAVSRIARLREMGFRIAIDDIGAGYAGLTSFAMLEPEVVKLDMALVRDIHKIPTKQKLVRSMVTLCKDLGIAIIAEGVETKDERDALLELDCDLFQGYLFAKPQAPWCTPVF